jgi:predicted Zn finger-like uncharacterized protein
VLAGPQTTALIAREDRLPAMITYCPQCATRFRVSPEQLAVRQGMVRCGQCGSVFNALEQVHRNEPKEEAQTPAEAGASEPALHAGRLTGHIERASPVPSWAPASDTVIARTSDAVAETTNERPAFALFQLLRGYVHADPPQPVWTPAIDDGAPGTSEAPTRSQEPSDAAFAEFAESLESADSVDAVSTAQETDLDFRPAPPGPRPGLFLFRPDLIQQPTARRITMIAAASLLSLALVAQFVFLFRTEIAANWPDVKPYLVGACGLLGCSVPLPRQLDNVSIEASELQADPAHSNVVLVTAILRNRGSTLEAYPTLEITFTDTLDRPLARRSLDAADYLSQRPGKDEGIPAAGEAVAKAAIEAVDLKPSGYRLRLYYR